MTQIICECGRPIERAPGNRRIRCHNCSRIYDPRDIGWHTPQQGTAASGEIEIQGLDRPLDWYPVDWRYEPEDLERIRWGLLRRSMEDKWFVCICGDELWILRSWTGLLCYKVVLGEGGISRIGVAHDIPNHPWAVEMAKWIVESKLIGLDVPFP